MKYKITNQRELRRQFWAEHPGLSRHRSRSFIKPRVGVDVKVCPADTRIAWVEWIDYLAWAGFISDALSRRANLVRRTHAPCPHRLATGEEAQAHRGPHRDEAAERDEVSVSRSKGEGVTLMKVNRPVKGYDYWDSHPDYPLEDWRYEVNANDTRLGYWSWVRARLEEDKENT